MGGGLGGYYLKQTQDDELDGQKVGPDGNCAQVFAFGPAVKYDYKGMSFIGTWNHETGVENYFEGNKFFFKFITACWATVRLLRRVEPMQTAIKQSIVHWETVNAVVTAAVGNADKPGIHFNVPVVDAGGNLTASLRIPGGLACNLNYGGGLVWRKRVAALKEKPTLLGSVFYQTELGCLL